MGHRGQVLIGILPRWECFSFVICLAHNSASVAFYGACLSSLSVASGGCLLTTHEFSRIPGGSAKLQSSRLVHRLSGTIFMIVTRPSGHGSSKLSRLHSME